MNPLFNALGGGQMPGMMGQFQNMMRQFQQFKQSFQGDPRAEVEKLVQSGKISQQQLNQLQQVASQFQQLLGLLRFQIVATIEINFKIYERRKL